MLYAIFAKQNKSNSRQSSCATLNEKATEAALTKWMKQKRTTTMKIRMRLG